PVTDVRVDNTAPTTSLDDPAANVRGTVTLTGAAADEGSGVVQVQFQVSPAGASTWLPLGIASAAPYSVELDTTTLPDGLYDLRAVATGVAGNVGASPVVTSRVDNTPPATTDNAPSGWQSSAVTVTLSASDAGSGPSATEYSVDGGPFQSGTSVDVQAPSDGSNDGSHTIAYFSTDVAGNVEAVHSTDVLIDASSPGSHPTDPGAYLRGPVTLHA